MKKGFQVQCLGFQGLGFRAAEFGILSQIKRTSIPQPRSLTVHALRCSH